MTRPPPQEPQSSVSSQDLAHLRFDLFRLYETLRRLNDHIQARYADSGDDILLDSLADINRTYAHVELLEKEADLFVTARWTACPRCHGDGVITQRGVLLQRAFCPDCQGEGRPWGNCCSWPL